MGFPLDLGLDPQVGNQRTGDLHFFPATPNIGAALPGLVYELMF